MRPIFYVFCPETHYTRYQHSTLESATKEAERLARLHPGRFFQVLAAINQTICADIHREFAPGIHVEDAPDTPF